MVKPNNYEETKVAGEFTPIIAGGHLCVIKQVEECKSKTGLDMLKISIDTDTTDAQPKYFEESFKNDIRPDKKWGCVMYLVVDQSTDYGTKNLKTFCTSAEESNEGFTVQWGDKFAACFKNKKIGVVFGREQYLNSNNEIKWSTKPKWFRSTKTVLDAEIPAEKLVNAPNGITPQMTDADGFMSIPDNIEELPFQ